MTSDPVVFMCPICFKVCESEQECHAHRMMACRMGPVGDERRKPMLDARGRMVSRAPRWFLEAKAQRAEF